MINLLFTLFILTINRLLILTAASQLGFTSSTLNNNGIPPRKLLTPNSEPGIRKYDVTKPSLIQNLSNSLTEPISHGQNLTLNRLLNKLKSNLAAKQNRFENSQLLEALNGLKQKLELLNNNPIDENLSRFPNRFKIFGADFKNKIPIADQISSTGMQGSPAITGVELTNLINGKVDIYQNQVKQLERKLISGQLLSKKEIQNIKLINITLDISIQLQTLINQHPLLVQTLLDLLDQPELQDSGFPAIRAKAARELPKICFDAGILPIDCYTYLLVVLGPSLMSEFGLNTTQNVIDALNIGPANFTSTAICSLLGHHYQELQTVFLANLSVQTSDFQKIRFDTILKILSQFSGFTKNKIARILHDNSYLDTACKKFYHRSYIKITRHKTYSKSSKANYLYCTTEITVDGSKQNKIGIVTLKENLMQVLKILDKLSLAKQLQEYLDMIRTRFLPNIKAGSFIISNSSTNLRQPRDRHIIELLEMGVRSEFCGYSEPGTAGLGGKSEYFSNQLEEETILFFLEKLLEFFTTNASLSSMPDKEVINNFLRSLVSQPIEHLDSTGKLKPEIRAELQKFTKASIGLKTLIENSLDYFRQIQLEQLQRFKKIKVVKSKKSRPGPAYSKANKKKYGFISTPIAGVRKKVKEEKGKNQKLEPIKTKPKKIKQDKKYQQVKVDNSPDSGLGYPKGNLYSTPLSRQNLQRPKDYPIVTIDDINRNEVKHLRLLINLLQKLQTMENVWNQQDFKALTLIIVSLYQTHTWDMWENELVLLSNADLDLLDLLHSANLQKTFTTLSSNPSYIQALEDRKIFSEWLTYTEKINAQLEEAVSNTDQKKYEKLKKAGIPFETEKPTVFSLRNESKEKTQNHEIVQLSLGIPKIFEVISWNFFTPNCLLMWQPTVDIIFNVGTPASITNNIDSFLFLSGPGVLVKKLTPRAEIVDLIRPHKSFRFYDPVSDLQLGSPESPAGISTPTSPRSPQIRAFWKNERLGSITASKPLETINLEVNLTIEVIVLIQETTIYVCGFLVVKVIVKHIIVAFLQKKINGWTVLFATFYISLLCGDSLVQHYTLFSTGWLVLNEFLESKKIDLVVPMSLISVTSIICFEVNIVWVFARLFLGLSLNFVLLKPATIALNATLPKKTSYTLENQNIQQKSYLLYKQALIKSIQSVFL